MIGYFLNPQFRYGEFPSDEVEKEVMDGMKNVISRLEIDVDSQIAALNQLLIFRDKAESIGTVQVQHAWKKMQPADWWITFGLQAIAIKVLSQTSSSSNSECNWSTFGYIHTKTRKRLKYEKLQKLVFVHYNMRLKHKHMMRRSREKIEESFNLITFDHIFTRVEPILEWLVEREAPLLDGNGNPEWLNEEGTNNDREEGVRSSQPHPSASQFVAQQEDQSGASKEKNTH
ncbi:uncharacterized protein LOC116199913 isoform X2 [Punica granatum]|uniref:Uncharacterized protein LOC116199913 isoform X2 n=1 Tax=Punica granatum TaxID=22663 RepID=A0A6P8CY28_PUNGR|nr:uncharacterized protein LOC116199913 isoform X2 [Punica granatum]